MKQPVDQEKNVNLIEESNDKRPVESNTILILNDNIVVSFISVGAGINSSALKQLESFIHEFEQYNSVKITFNKINYGREGEIDFCFDLSPLKDDCRGLFLSKSKDILANKENVRYQENKTCRNK